MSYSPYSPLPDRAILAITGEDSYSFLQGIISNDIHKVTEENAIYALVLTPQGKYLHDMFISKLGDVLFLEYAQVRKQELLRKLTMYKLRSKVAIEDVSDRYISAFLAEAAPSGKEGRAEAYLGGVAYIDPRSAEMGWRAIMPKEAAVLAAPALAYDAVRIHVGIAEGEKDLLPEQSFPLEYGMEELHAIDFKKGCYVGQEVTARTKYRGVVRKKIVRIKASAILPEAGTFITAEGAKIGTLCSHIGQQGLALLRIEEYGQAMKEGKRLQAGECEVRVAE